MEPRAGFILRYGLKKNNNPPINSFSSYNKHINCILYPNKCERNLNLNKFACLEDWWSGIVRMYTLDQIIYELLLKTCKFIKMFSWLLKLILRFWKVVCRLSSRLPMFPLDMNVSEVRTMKTLHYLTWGLVKALKLCSGWGIELDLFSNQYLFKKNKSWPIVKDGENGICIEISTA